MQNDDTIQLLNECDAGVKTAISSIDELIERVQDKNLFDIMKQYRDDHVTIGERIKEKLDQYHEEGKEPNPMAKAMSWMKINAKMFQNPTDQEAADLLMDGCNMGIKSVCKYQNKYKAANHDAKTFAKDIVDLEQKLMVELRAYL